MSLPVAPEVRVVDGAVDHRVEGDRREHGRHQHADVERRHQAAAAVADDQRADDRRQDADAAQHERQHHGGVAEPGQRGQEHRADDGHRVGLEQVGRHAGVVADVVADVVRDHGRVARIVLGDAGLDLAHQVGADVGALGEDAAAQPREHGDQRAAEGQADQGPGRLDVRVIHGLQDPVVAGHADDAQRDDEDAGDGAALEGDGQRRRHAALRAPRRCGRSTARRRSSR